MSEVKLPTDEEIEGWAGGNTILAGSRESGIYADGMKFMRSLAEQALAAKDAEIGIWKMRFKALTGFDSPDIAGNRVIEMKAEIERLEEIIKNKAAENCPHSFVEMRWACGHTCGSSCQKCFEAKRSELAALKARERELLEIFVWLLGYNEFPERPEGGGAYGWRSHLVKKLSDIGVDINGGRTVSTASNLPHCTCQWTQISHPHIGGILVHPTKKKDDPSCVVCHPPAITHKGGERELLEEYEKWVEEELGFCIRGVSTFLASRQEGGKG